MSKTLSALENYTKIQSASMMSCDEILYKNISTLLVYRRELAVQILKSNGDTPHELHKCYEYTDFKLKKILNL